MKSHINTVRVTYNNVRSKTSGFDFHFHFQMPDATSGTRPDQDHKFYPNCFWDLFMQHKVLHQKPGVAHLQYPKWYSSTHAGCNISGFPWRKRAAVPPLHVSILRCRIKARRGAFATRHKPLDRSPSIERIGDN